MNLWDLNIVFFDRIIHISIFNTTEANMATGKIKFGTDGFRGIIADDFTFENVKK